MKLLLDLFITYLKIGLFTFGGGYAMIPLIENCCVDKKSWITHEEMMNITVIAESTPGPVAINCATYVGLKKKGVAGAVAATTAVALPAFLTVIILTLLLKNFVKRGAVQALLGTLKACVAGIILATGAYMIQINCVGSRSNFSVDYAAIIMTVLLGAAYFGSEKVMKRKMSPIVLICLAGCAGVLAYGR